MLSDIFKVKESIRGKMAQLYSNPSSRTESGQPIRTLSLAAPGSKSKKAQAQTRNANRGKLNDGKTTISQKSKKTSDSMRGKRSLSVDNHGLVDKRSGSSLEYRGSMDSRVNKGGIKSSRRNNQTKTKKGKQCAQCSEFLSKGFPTSNCPYHDE